MSELLESLKPIKMEVLVKRLRRLKTSVLLKRPKRLKLRRRNRLFANPYTHILCRSPSPQYANHFNPDCCVCGEEADPRKDAMIKGSIYRYCEVREFSYLFLFFSGANSWRLPERLLHHGQRK